MQIGQLDRRIVLESPTLVANSYGEETITWSDYLTVWAMVEWKGGSEKEESDKLTAKSKVVFTVRNLGNLVDETYRILYKTKYYYIQAINEIDGREMFLELLTENRD